MVAISHTYEFRTVVLTICFSEIPYLNIAHGSNLAYRDREMRSVFPLSQCQRNLILLFSRYKPLCESRKNIWTQLRSCFKVNEWCLVDCFHREFRVSTQITSKYAIIASQNKKKFSACGGLSMALRTIFSHSKYLRWFKPCIS